jgi:hypothetical protein
VSAVGLRYHAATDPAKRLFASFPRLHSLAPRRSSACLGCCCQAQGGCSPAAFAARAWAAGAGWLASLAWFGVLHYACVVRRWGSDS